MGRMGDFLDSFKPGPTKPGMWGQREEFGRFEGTGEVTAELELPEAHVAVSIEEHIQVEDLGLELTGPGASPLKLERYSASDFDTSDSAVHRLFRIASGEVPDAGLHHLRVKAPSPDQPLLIMVGREMTVRGELKDMADEMIPGRKLWKRLKGGS
jgi:hypothetical protein